MPANFDFSVEILKFSLTYNETFSFRTAWLIKKSAGLPPHFNDRFAQKIKSIVCGSGIPLFSNVATATNTTKY
jgi:hypothetical protein